MIFKRQIHNFLLKRNITTVNKINSTHEIKRPTPILFLKTVLNDKEHEKYKQLLEKEWQNKLSDIGYSSYATIITLPPKSDKDPISACYQELKNTTSELSFFPPIMISLGEIESRISGKFVANKPVSGLIMVDEENPIDKERLNDYPIYEYEPHFPILVLSNNPPMEFLDGYVDTDTYDKEENFNKVLNWFDEYGM